MSSETLSQNDIDRLLGNNVPERASARSNVPSDVQIYDFRRPARVSKERLRTLEAMYERLVKSLEGWVISRVRGQIEVRLQSVEQFSFGEFTLSLPTPCSSYIFDIGTTGQKGVIDIGPEFGFYVIDRVFGGTGQGATLTRSLTPIERMAMRTVADRVAQLTEEIWQDHVPLELQVSAFESSPEILQIANREDPVLVANLEITAAGQSSLMLICLPFSVLDKFFTSGSQQRVTMMPTSDTERAAAVAKSEAALRETPVPIRVTLPTFTMRLEDLVGLSVGSVIPTGIPKDARLLVRAGEQERFVGQAGRVSGMMAVRIVDTVTPHTF